MLANRWSDVAIEKHPSTENIVYAWACRSVANLGELTLRHDGN
jgi:hypothetical protein